MICDVCGKVGFHNSRCPRYPQQIAVYYCASCGEGICSGEEYIENDIGEYKHLDCIYGTKDLLEWLGYEIKTMEDEYE